MNNVGALIEFRTFAEAPEYIHKLGEVIGECTGLIPLRSFKQNTNLTRLERWNEIRAMFKDDKVILKMMDVDPASLGPRNFHCLDVVQRLH